MKSRVKQGINDFESWCKMNNRKDLLDEWDFVTNGFKPSEIAYGSHKIISWICPQCHNSYKSNVPNRRFGNNCPYCSNQKVKQGLNDFESFCSGGEWEYLLREWDYDKNTIKPNEIARGSGKKIWWICKNCGYSYDTTISHRMAGRSCPYCKNDGRKKAMPGFNDFKSYCEKNGGEYLLEEWDYEKNAFLPSEITSGSTKPVWWKCPKCGNAFKMLVTKRQRGDGCPKCGAYLKTSFREQALYYYISQAYPNSVNRYTDKGFEIDIYIPELRLGIEYDGQFWHQDKAKDIEKSEKCKDKGIKLLHIREPGCVPLSIDGVYNLKDISERVFETTIRQLFQDYNIFPIDVDLNRDRLKICSVYLNSEYENSLEYKYPQIASEWIVEDNEGIEPSRVSCYSNIKAAWLCPKCGNKYYKRVAERVVRNSACPYCVNRAVQVGMNDLTTTYPDIAKEWHPLKNGPLKPTDVTYGCDKKVWWLGSCGHEWKTQVYNRTKGIGCPYCSNRRVLPGYNDLATTHPDLASQWNYEKNKELTPEMVTAGSAKKVWWSNYSCGHIFKQNINSRIMGIGCPVCSGRQGRIITKVETGEVFDSLRKAAESCGRTNVTNIQKCVNGEIKTAYGFQWKVVINEENLLNH